MKNTPTNKALYSRVKAKFKREKTSSQRISYKHNR